MNRVADQKNEWGARTRRQFPALLAAAATDLAAQARRPNVLLITVDDLNTDLGCFGHPLVESPNVDRLARRGVRFDRAYTQYPVCNPSRTSFLSGRYPETTGVLDNRVNPRTNLGATLFLPEFLRRNGYFTARVGKTYHDGMDGANDWDVSLDPRPTTRIGRTGAGRNLTDGKLPYMEVREAEGTDEDQPDGLIAAEAVRLLEQKRSQPFFLSVGLRKPHDPYIAPQKYFAPYPMSRIAEAAGPLDDDADIPPIAFHRPGGGLGQAEGREFRRAYYACISFMDAQLGKVLTALDRSGNAGNTLVLFYGDHGLHLGEHGCWNKVTLFERSARVPLIVVPPGASGQGAICRKPVELLSVFSTIASQCRLAPPDGLEGPSLSPLLSNPEATWTRPAYSVVLRPGNKMGRAIRTQRHAYIEWDEGREGIELYDHWIDPHEYRNLSGKTEHAAVERELKQQLAAARPGKKPGVR